MADNDLSRMADTDLSHMADNDLLRMADTDLSRMADTSDVLCDQYNTAMGVVHFVFCLFQNMQLNP
jgi:hypothetical protein